MQDKLATDRELRDIHDPFLRNREHSIRRIEKSFGYSRDDSEKVYDIMKVNQMEQLFGTVIGGVCALKIGAIQRELAHSIRIFRKPWLRYCSQAAVFAMSYYCGIMIPSRVLYKLDH